MNKYKVLIEGITINDVAQEVGAVIELSEKDAEVLVTEGKVEAVEEADEE